MYVQQNITQSLKKWNNATCSNMDGSRDYCTKGIMSEENKYLWYPFSVKSKKNIQMNIFTK